MPLATAFYNQSSIHCESAEWNNWSGYLAATVYEPSHEREYFAIRNAVGVIDVSPLYKYEITGPDAETALDRIITRDLQSCNKGQVYYTPWCNEQGKIIDDGTVFKFDQQHFRITAAEPNLAWFEDVSYGLNVNIEDSSTNLAALAVQGPNSKKLLSQLVDGIDFEKLKFFYFSEGSFDRKPLIVSRTGYTGDLGYEIWVSPEYAENLWQKMFDLGSAYGILPVGTAALDITRIEAGLLLIGVDYIPSRLALTESQKSSPYDAGLGWAVSPKAERYIGGQALQQEKKHGSRWLYAGLRCDWDHLQQLYEAEGLPPQVAGRACREAVPIFKNGQQVGQATSQVFSPILKQYIALASLESSHVAMGDNVELEMTVEFQRQRVRATVENPCFYNPAHKRL